MIGVFDSGLGGLTVVRELTARFPQTRFVYFADHARVPYGDRPSEEILAFTRDGVDALFRHGARLALLGCNTATAISARWLQQTWLPKTDWTGRNVLGIVAPTVEAATQTPWAAASPQYPQKFNADLIAVFGTTRTVASDVYPAEILKRCPRATVVQQVCSDLAGAIERDAGEPALEALVVQAVDALLSKTGGQPPHRAILGCTHFPLVEHLFRRRLPPHTRILAQPAAVADSLEDYLARRPHYKGEAVETPSVELLTTGDPAEVSARAKVFWPEAGAFAAA